MLSFKSLISYNKKMPTIKVKYMIPIERIEIKHKEISYVYNEALMKRVVVGTTKCNKKPLKEIISKRFYKFKSSKSAKTKKRLKNNINKEPESKIYSTLQTEVIDKIVNFSELLEHQQFDNDGYLSIHKAVCTNDIQTLGKIINVIEKFDCIINLPTKNRLYTPLHIAIIIRSDLKIIKLLLSKGANPLIQDKFSKNCFHYAADCTSYKYMEMMIGQVFVGKNAAKLIMDYYFFMGHMVHECYGLDDPLITNNFFKIAFTSVDEQGNTPIMECVSRKKYSNLLFILKKLPKVVKQEIIDFRNPLNGKTALFLAGQCDIDDNHQSKFTTEAENCVVYLLINKANPHICSYAGHNPLKLARRTSNIWLLNILNMFIIKNIIK